MRWAAAVLLPSVLLLGGCERETRRYHELPAASSRPEGVRLTQLQPGVAKPDQTHVLSPYQKNAYGIAEGKRLYEAYNCVGCHAHGGGGIGPALMDDKWIYGSEPDQIFSTIVQGRPNGMPSFGGHIPEQQIWEIVAYVESLSGNVPQDAAPSRDDDLNVKVPENRVKREAPREVGHR